MNRRQWLLTAVAFGWPDWMLRAQSIEATWDETFDVLVVGAGAAGLAAALSAAEDGAQVLLIEKQSYIGGDLMKTGGFFNAAGSPEQKALGIKDSVELYERHILEVGKGKNSPQLAAILARESLPALEWLRSIGVRFEPTVYQIYGSLHRRCHRPLLPGGRAYAQALSEACLKHGVTIRANCPLSKILVEKNGAVLGVQTHFNGKSQSIRAHKGVVLAAGGFGANPKAVAKYSARHQNLTVDSNRGSTGEVLEAALAIGAAIENMESIESIPEGAPSEDLSVRIYMVTRGIMFVNSKAERFIDESAPRREITEALLKETTGDCYTIVDSTNVASLDTIQRKNLYRSLFAGFVWRADTIEELAKLSGLPSHRLLKSLEETAEHIRPSKPPFWMVKMHPWIHYTLGGLKINDKAACLDAAGQPIPGLFAAGQITGNVHGAGRLGGNGLTDAIVFGRIAGRNAARR